MTTDREHVAMIAAGMTDQELAEALANDELCWSRMIQGVLADERENRDQARFQMDLSEKAEVMALDTAKVTTRAYSDLCNVSRFADDVALDPAVRMEMIGLVVDDYRRAVAGSVGKVIAVKEARRRFPLLWSIADSIKRLSR